MATRAGVAKTSIYRRHPNRAALLTAVLANAIGVPELPAEGTVREKIRSALEQAWREANPLTMVSAGEGGSGEAAACGPDGCAI